MTYLDKDGNPIELGCDTFDESCSNFDPFFNDSPFDLKPKRPLQRLISSILSKPSKSGILIQRVYTPRETRSAEPAFFKRTSKKPTKLELSIMKSRIKLRAKLKKGK